MKFSKVVAPVRQAERTFNSQQVDITDYQIGLARSAIRDDWAMYVRNDGLHVGFVQAEHGGAIERHAVHELSEYLLDFRQRLVSVQVLSIDCRNHGNDGSQ